MPIMMVVANRCFIYSWIRLNKHIKHVSNPNAIFASRKFNKDNKIMILMHMRNSLDLIN